MAPIASADKLLDEARSAIANGRVEVALARIDRASASNFAPRHAEALFAVGNLLAERSEHAAAISVFERALKLSPGNASVLINLGLQFDAAGEPRRAERCYRDVLARRPDEVAALANLAYLLFSQERLADARAVYHHLVFVAPDAPAEVWNNLGVCEKSARDEISAEQSFRRALALQPDSPQVLANLGFLLYGQMRYEASRAFLRRGHELDPGRLQLAAQSLDVDLQFADWRDFEGRAARLIEGLSALALPGAHQRQSVAPFTVLALCDDPSLQQIAARSFACPRSAATVAGVMRRSRDGRPLRLGFVSAALKEHPETRLLIGLLEELDRKRFDVYAYALLGADPTALRDRVIAATDRLRDVAAMDSDRIAEIIREDAIDILFDLTGHTSHSRPDVFAAKPAPIQVNFIGYAGTLGASYYDFVVTDAYTTPEGEQEHFDERLLALAHCYLPSDPGRVSGATPSRARYGLRDDAFVFMAQAAPYKILPQMFDTWARIVADIDGSVLWLRPMHPEAEGNLRREASRRGIAEDRLVFAPGEALPQYLARFALADLYLDTYPFGSHTTVNDALFAGLPVVALTGRSMAARASASQIRAVGLAEMVASTHDEYASIARALARDRARLADVAARLRRDGRASPLFDMASYARRFEDAVSRVAGGDVTERQ